MPTAKLMCLVPCVAAAACGGSNNGGNPTAVQFGDTALIVVINPPVNDSNRHAMPVPGDARGGVVVRTDDNVSATTDADGIAVLAPLTAGARTVSVTGSGIEASFAITLGDGRLREVAVAAAGTRAELMVNLDYTSDRAVTLSPTMTRAEIDAALAPSDRVVFLQGGVYTGDLAFTGSRVTLFGEGALGGAVTLQGNVTVSGSDSRIRGARITGNLTITASGTGLSFSQVDGTLSATGSDTTLLANALCGAETITGSGSIVVGNAGSAPTSTCP